MSTSEPCAVSMSLDPLGGVVNKRLAERANCLCLSALLTRSEMDVLKDLDHPNIVKFFVRGRGTSAVQRCRVHDG